MKDSPRRGFLALAAGLLAVAAPACGSHGDHVVVKVAELPERYSDVIVQGLAFSPDGTRIAIDSDGESVNIWEWRTRRIVKTVEQPRGFNTGFSTNPIQYSADGKLLAACAGKGVNQVVVRLWNTKDWSIAKDITDSGPGGCNAATFTSDGQFLVRIVDRTALSGENVIVHGSGSWLPLWGLQLDRFSPQSVAISPDGALVAIGGMLFVVPADVRDPLQRARQISSHPDINIVDLKQHKTIGMLQGDAMGPMAWSPDSTRLAIADHSFVEIFDVRSGNRLVHEEVKRSSRLNLRFTPDGRYLIESDMDGLGNGLGVKIWDNQRLKVLQEIAGNIGSVDVTRDSRYLAMGGHGRTTIWQLK